MKFSATVGTDFTKLEALAASGYKYYEFDFGGMARADDEKYNNFKATAERLGLTPVSSNGMFPGDIPLLTGEAGYEAIKTHLKKGFARANELGTPIVILGSGKARTIPEGMTAKEAEERFITVLREVIAPMAQEAGIIIGIEELRAEECNFINNCKEAMVIIKKLGHPNVKLLVDYYHSILGGDTVAELESFGEDIVHVHMASPKNTRAVPQKDIDFEDVKEFFAMLKRIGYEGAVSLEARFVDYAADLKSALALMTEAL